MILSYQSTCYPNIPRRAFQVMGYNFVMGCIMNTRVIRHDLRYFVSSGLLIVFAITAVTGFLSDLWDLNGFVYHKYAGYLLALLALAHVYLQGGHLLSYIRWRLRGHPKQRRSSPIATRQPVTQPLKTHQVKKVDQGGSSGIERRKLLSRRDLISLTLGGLGGLAIGNNLHSEPNLPYGSDVGTIYHEWSKPKVISLLGTVTNWGQNPPLYKEYANVQRIKLPPPKIVQGLSTEKAIEQRRSIRSFSKKAMTLDELSRLLYYTGGINKERWGHKLRSAPSAGALYPIEIYSVTHRVESLQSGLYHYAIKDHALEMMGADDLRGAIVSHGLMQEFLGQANLVLVFTAIFQRLRWKYRERSYRYALLEAGHLGQNVYLAGISMGLGVCAVGAFFDDDLNEMLGIDGRNDAAVYMLAVGKV